MTVYPGWFFMYSATFHFLKHCHETGKESFGCKRLIVENQCCTSGRYISSIRSLGSLVSRFGKYLFIFQNQLQCPRPQEWYVNWVLFSFKGKNILRSFWLSVMITFPVQQQESHFKVKKATGHAQYCVLWNRYGCGLYGWYNDKNTPTVHLPQMCLFLLKSLNVWDQS